jgi:type IV pilus assembly protein PilM
LNTVEALDFDPYRVWLNIKESARPLSPYQLLALSPLESDANRIKAGYLRQQSALLMHADKAEPQLWESIQQEVEEAYALLCDAEQKAVLDASIRRRSRQTDTKNGTSINGTSANGAPAILQLQCRHCQRSNPSSRRFCGGCGESLWETCPQCKAECPSDEQYCGSCGADILGELSQQSQQYQARIDEGRQLAAEHRYDAAISAFRGVAAVSDPRFEKWAQLALAEVERVRLAREENLAAAAAHLARAEQAVSSCSYETAISELQSIPASLRTADAKALLERAISAREEILKLGGEIRAALERKETDQLLPKLERLVALRPDHKQAIGIAEQLRNNLVKLAKRDLVAHRYRDALDQLEHIPSFVRSPEVETLSETASELFALLDGVKHAALADRATLALAERLAKLASTSEEAAKLKSLFAERVRTRPTDPRLGAADFSPAPRRTPLGAPVDWLAHPLALASGDSAVDSQVRERPGQFFVALGLALQGLDAVAIAVDLTPDDRSGMLKLLPGLSLGRKPAPAAWGIDLSETGIKAIKLERDAKGTAPRIAACEFIPHRRPLLQPGIDLERSELIAESLQTFVSRAGELKGMRIVAALPGHRVLGRFFEVPPLPAKKVDDAIAYEARHQLPIALEELCWSSRLLDAVPGRAADEQPRKMMVVAARQAHVRDRLAIFKAAGIELDAITSDCLALHNAAVSELAANAETPGSDEAVCLVDLGADGGNVVVSTPGSVWFRTFGQGGENVTSQLVKQFNLTHEQAEQVKREPAKARRYGLLREAVRPLLVQIYSEVERSLASFEKSAVRRPVRQIYLTGGAAQTPGLIRQLRFGK